MVAMTVVGKYPLVMGKLATLIGKGHRQAIVTLTERKSRFALLAKVDERKADQVGDKVIDLLSPFS